MATHPAHTRIQVEVYFHSSYEPDAEYVDGEIVDPASKQAWRFYESQLNLASTFGEPGDKIHFDRAEIEKLLD